MLVRIITACVCLPLLLAVLIFLPPIATALLFAVACMIAAYEMLWRTGIWKNVRAVVATALMAGATVLWSWLRSSALVSGETLWVCALACLLVYFILLFCELMASHARVQFTSMCAAIFSGLVYPFLIGALVRLRCMDGGIFYVMVAFLLSMVADTGAYFVGRACGKHKLAPVVSPKKTVEGAIGGAVFNVVAMCLYTLLLNRCFGFTQVQYLYAVIYGIVGAAVSILGDLTLSVVKRQVGIKDYGTIFPGHGGILDRFDSTMLVAPLTELLVLLLPFAVK